MNNVMTDKSFPRISRRNLLKGASFIGGLALSNSSRLTVSAKPKPEYEAYPFSLGVASGDPLPDSVVIWTRLAAPSLSNNLANATIPVRWFVAEDEQMNQLIAQGEGLALPELGHSLHIVVENLQPDRFYWYQFQMGEHFSPVGRTRTTPIGSADKLAFAFVSCQNYEHGYFNAYRYLAKEELDFVVHLGDYIYEGTANPARGFPRSHGAPEPVDLEGYRQRYTLYRSDPDLQEAHRLFPFICTWDDHEVDNDYANLLSAKFDDVEWFRKRRADAYQAYYEFLPLRPFCRPQAENMQLYRHFDWGDLARFYVLDTRQFRDDQPCDDNGRGGSQVIYNCEERVAQQRSLLGQEQEKWLYEGLSSSSAHWNVIAQPYLFSQLKITLTEDGVESFFLSDAWDGYPANRQRILEFISQKRPSNPVFIGGDIHSFWVNQVHRDFDDPDSEIIAAEFVGTSISANNRVDYNLLAAIVPINPHVQFFESRLRGYVKCDISANLWQAQLKVVDTVKQPQSKISTLAIFQVQSGSSKIERV